MFVCVFSCLFVFQRKMGEEHSGQKEHKNILCEGPGAVLNLNFSLRHKDI